MYTPTAGLLCVHQLLVCYVYTNCWFVHSQVRAWQSAHVCARPTVDGVEYVRLDAWTCAVRYVHRQDVYSVGRDVQWQRQLSGVQQRAAQPSTRCRRAVLSRYVSLDVASSTPSLSKPSSPSSPAPHRTFSTTTSSNNDQPPPRRQPHQHHHQATYPTTTITNPASATHHRQRQQTTNSNNPPPPTHQQPTYPTNKNDILPPPSHPPHPPLPTHQQPTYTTNKNDIPPPPSHPPYHHYQLTSNPHTPPTRTTTHHYQATYPTTTTNSPATHLPHQQERHPTTTKPPTPPPPSTHQQPTYPTNKNDIPPLPSHLPHHHHQLTSNPHTPPPSSWSPPRPSCSSPPSSPFLPLCWSVNSCLSVLTRRIYLLVLSTLFYFGSWYWCKTDDPLRNVRIRFGDLNNSDSTEEAQDRASGPCNEEAAHAQGTADGRDVVSGPGPGESANKSEPEETSGLPKHAGLPALQFESSIWVSGEIRTKGA